MLDLLTEAAAWTAERGFANWPGHFPRALVTTGLQCGELFVAEIENEMVATLALSWSDAMFWGEQPPVAGYLHRLAVRRNHAGRDLGAQLVEWAARRVVAEGRTRLRLDVAADNVPLRRYYERLGFAHCGDTEGERAERDGGRVRWSTSRYERVEEEARR